MKNLVDTVMTICTPFGITFVCQVHWSMVTGLPLWSVVQWLRAFNAYGNWLQGFHIYNVNQWNLDTMEEEWHLEIEKRYEAWESRVAKQDKEGKKEEDEERCVCVSAIGGQEIEVEVCLTVLYRLHASDRAPVQDVGCLYNFQAQTALLSCYGKSRLTTRMRKRGRQACGGCVGGYKKHLFFCLPCPPPPFQT
jgi:hypothetical protein